MSPMTRNTVHSQTFSRLNQIYRVFLDDFVADLTLFTIVCLYSVTRLALLNFAPYDFSFVGVVADLVT